MENEVGDQQHDDFARRPETEAGRQARLEREEALIAQGEAEIAAGLWIEDDDFEAWLDALDVDPTTPAPSPRNGSANR